MSGSGYKRAGPAGWKPDTNHWLGEIRKGMEWRDKLTSKVKWDLWRKWYRGQYQAGTLPMNVYFKMLRTMVPRVYFRNPSVSIRPRKHQQGQLDFWLFSQLLEQVDNALFDRMKLKKAMKRAVQDAFMFGTGGIKLGYGGQFNAAPDPVEVTEPPLSKKGEKVEYSSFILPDTPWTMRVPTGRFMVPKDTLDWESARWFAHEEIRNVHDVQEDRRFKNVKDLSPGVLSTRGENTIGKAADVVSVVEIRDKKTEKVFVIAPTQKEKVLAFEDDTMQFDNRISFFPIIYNPDDDYFWGIPDALVLEPHQLEINEIRRVMRMHRRISLLKYMLKKGALDHDQLTKLLSPNEVGAVIEFEKDMQGFDSVIKMFQAGDIPSGLVKADQMEERVIQEVLGMGVNQFGEYAPGSADRSATEATIVNQAVQIRTDERRDINADAIVDLTEHMNHVLLTQWSGEQVVSIAGPEGEEIWVKFKQADIKSLEYDVHVDPDSAVPETRQLRRQNAAQTLQMFGQNQVMDLPKLTKWTLTEMGGPSMIDLMLNGGKPQAPQAPMVEQGGPGSSPAKAMDPSSVIQMLAKKQGGGG